MYLIKDVLIVTDVLEKHWTIYANTGRYRQYCIIIINITSYKTFPKHVFKSENAVEKVA